MPDFTGTEELAECDISKLVECQLEAYAGELSTMLGSEFLLRYYRFLIRHPDAFVLVISSARGGKILGFCVGSAAGIQKEFFRAHTLFVMSVLTKQVFLKPDLRKSLLRRIVRKCRELGNLFDFVGKLQTERVSDPVFWLHLICVSPSARGAGIGETLLKDFVQLSSKMGYRKARLTVATNNRPAAHLYEKLGWRIEGRMQDLLVYEYDI